MHFISHFRNFATQRAKFERDFFRISSPALFLARRHSHRFVRLVESMPPRSILKKRPVVETEEIEEVPASGPSAERPQNEPESETDDEELPYDSDEGESFDETDDEADEDAIREMGEGKQKGPKSASSAAPKVIKTDLERVRRAETHDASSHARADVFPRFEPSPQSPADRFDACPAERTAVCAYATIGATSEELDQGDESESFGERAR